jgi:transposase
VAASRPKRGRPPVLDPSHFEDVASIYLDASARGESPLSAIAAEKGVARSTAAKWASQCRERGLLARTVQGKGSGSGRIEKRGRRS